MKFTIVSSIIDLLSATVWCQYSYNEVNLINRLNEFFGFDQNIFVLDSLIDQSRYIPTKDNIDGNFTARTIFIFDHNSDNNANDEQVAILPSVTGKKTFLIIVAKSLLFVNNPQLLHEVKAIRLLIGANVKIGVFFVGNGGNVTSIDTIKQLLRWSRSAGIVNIFCSSYSNVQDDLDSLNIFRYNSFWTFDLINVTESASLQNYFPSKVPNYHENPLRLVHSRRIFNHEGKFWDTVARVFNASTSMKFKNLDTTGIETTEILVHEMIVDPERHICTHREETLVLLVPHAEPYTNFVAYLQNTTWMLLFTYTFITVVAACVLLTISGYLRTRKVLLIQYVVDVVNLLMNDNAAIRYGELNRADFCVIVPLTFTGLIVANGILSVFQSYLTWPIYERQIRTIDDLFKSPVPIFQHIPTGLSIKLLNELSGHDGWNNKVHQIEDSELQKEISEFNNSIAYVLQDEIQGVQVYLEVQKRLGLKAYHLIVERYMLKSFVSYHLNTFFPFTEPINDIIRSLNSAGLINKWIKDENELLIKDVFEKMVNHQLKSSNKPNRSEFIVPAVVWCGWIVSVIVFVCELVWTKIKPLMEKLK